MDSNEVCRVCLLGGGDASLMRCSRCHTVAYCSEACQKKDWKNVHKLECVKKDKDHEVLMDVSRDLVMNVCGMKEIQTLVGAYAYFKGDNVICNVELLGPSFEGDGIKYKCSVYILPEEDLPSKFHGQFNLNFFTNIFNVKYAHCMSSATKQCKRAYTMLSKELHFNKFDPLIIITDLQEYFAIQYGDELFRIPK